MLWSHGSLVFFSAGSVEERLGEGLRVELSRQGEAAGGDIRPHTTQEPGVTGQRSSCIRVQGVERVSHWGTTGQHSEALQAGAV